MRICTKGLQQGLHDHKSLARKDTRQWSLMDTHIGTHKRRTIGVLPGWPGHEDSRPDSYLISVFRGIQSAALTRDCHILLAWGVGRNRVSVFAQRT